MCGFIGHLHDKNSLNKIEKALDLIQHRGPDNKKIIYDNETKFLLGFCRLSIQDTSDNAMQPFIDKKKKIIILFNGEIYNFQKLRKELISINYEFRTSSDTEVLLNAYKEWGIDKMLSRIEGMFSFVIIDKRIQKVLMARDHFGMKPLYFSEDNGLKFSSEIKSITYLSETMTWNKQGAISSLFTGMAQVGATPYNNVREIKPGNYMVYDLTNKILTGHEYFSPRNLVNEDEYININKMSDNQVVEYFNELLNKSVNDHLVSDVKVGSCFSAGLDSSLISALATQNSKSEEIKLFCFLSKVDKKIIKKSANKFLNRFGNELIYVDEESHSDLISEITKNLFYTEMPNKIEGSALSKMCNFAYKSGYKVLLTGDAADEILGGYHFHKQFYNRSISSKSKFNFLLKLINLMQPINLFELSNADPVSTDYFSQPAHLDLFELQHNLMINRNKRLRTWKKNQEAYSFIKNKNNKNTQAFILDSIYYKLSKYLHRSDRYGMRNSVELRVPYLNTNFVSACLNLELKRKINFSLFRRKIQDKFILRKLSKFNKIPKIIINRKKIGTNMNYKEQLLNLCQNVNFEHCEEILKVKKEEIKYNLLNSEGPNIEMFQYNFISHEILGKLFIENKKIDQVIENFRK
tara:strand:+ start:5589 stop:7493 length:1905 start_codon:yes stop_codon:yes gene_type:complete